MKKKVLCFLFVVFIVMFIVGAICQFLGILKPEINVTMFIIGIIGIVIMNKKRKY